jgi:hypothetical protein
MIAGVGFISVVTLSGIGLAAAVRPLASAETWRTLSSVGDAFGVVALFALVGTFVIQYRELRRQHAELQIQRQAITLAQRALGRTAEAEVRKLHVQLVKMSLDDPELAEVWPRLTPGLPPARLRQYLFANLILQHVATALTIGDITEEHAKAAVRYMFTSPLMREYWAATRADREQTVVQGTRWADFVRLTDEVFSERRGDDRWPMNRPRPRHPLDEPPTESSPDIEADSGQSESS